MDTADRLGDILGLLGLDIEFVSFFVCSHGIHKRIFDSWLCGNDCEKLAVREIIIGGFIVLDRHRLALNLHLLGADRFHTSHEKLKLCFGSTYISIALNCVVCIQISLSEFDPGRHIGRLLLVESSSLGSLDFLGCSLGVL